MCEKLKKKAKKSWKKGGKAKKIDKTQNYWLFLFQF